MTAVILAAGKSTRMKSKRVKVLHEVCGRPMLEYVVRACYEAGVTRIIMVVGHGKDDVITQFGDDRRISFVEQNPQLGTGHAVMVCRDELKKVHGDVLIMVGDGPLVRAEVLRKLHQAHVEQKADASMATATMDNPFGYGRIYRDASGEFVAIVEEIDCTPEQRQIREVFPSYYCVKVDQLIHALGKLDNKNRKNEYYLTDIFAILRREGKKITALQAVAPEDIMGVNDRRQLAEIDQVMQDRIQRQLLESGVTIVNRALTYIESGVSVGQDTVIQPFTFVGRDTTIGADCVIGPFARIPRESVVPEGITIMGHPTQDAELRI